MHSGNLITYIDRNAVVKVIKLFTINNGSLYFGRKKNRVPLFSPCIY